MGGKRVSLEEKEQYIYLREMGANISEAAKRIGRSRDWAHRFEQSLSPERKALFIGKSARPSDRPERPVDPGDLSEEALRALDDFEFFRRRYFGHVSTPWQVEAANRLRELLESDADEYVVMNTPPGAGKTTLFTCDIPAWLICRNRAVRVLLGHRVQSMANTYSGRLRSMFARRVPVRADERQKRLGLACDAEATLQSDFGAFKPTTSDELWRRDAFTVVQDGELRSDEKESTVVAFGSDSGQLGYRADYIVWDDLETARKATEQSMEDKRQWFDDEAESRLEPGGVFVLVGQRLAANDMYRYCLDKRRLTEDDFEDLDAEASGEAVYRHIVFRAHDEDRCENEHGLDAQPWPDGCLLDPRRLSWRKLQKVRADERKYRVLYQQEDVDPAAVLVPKLWVEGGRDPVSGEVFPGCWDKDRRLCELPSGLRPPLLSIATCDPSPSRYWAIEWFVYQPSTGMRFLMDLERRAMDAPDFLDWSQATQSHSGIMESWQRRSKGMGLPIQWWVIEQNAAQRWLFQFEHFRTWQAKHSVRVIGHDTHGVNKADPEFGLEGRLKPIFRDGLIRLPGSQDGVTRTASLKLVDEATRYPDSGTDDTLMALWFMEHNLRQMTTIDPDRQPRTWVPGFVKEAA